jgi:hypothetical protein
LDPICKQLQACQLALSVTVNILVRRFANAKSLRSYEYSFFSDMHQGLSIAEIFANICEYVNQPVGHAGSRRTVFALALTCKSFLEPSLDVLWRSQHSLAYLVKTLPADAWQQTCSPRKIVSLA